MYGEPTAPSPLATTVDLLRAVSGESDPQRAIRIYQSHIRALLPMDRTLLLSRQNLDSPWYRVTPHDRWGQDGHPWLESDHLPRLDRGLLGELLYRGEPRLIACLAVGPDDPGAEHLAGMKSLAAIPHFDDGQVVHMVVLLRRTEAGFAPADFPGLVLICGLLDRAVRGLVQAYDLRQAQERLTEQYTAVTQLSDTILEQARALKAHARTLEERVHQRTLELERSHLDAIYMLAAASEERDAETGRHLQRIEALTFRLAQGLKHTPAQSRTLSHAAVLHDVGKLHVPDEILLKPGPLTPEERRVMQEHTLAGERILAGRDGFALARRIARSHHENWDGTGYPDGLAGAAIPPEARIVHLVDVFDALESVRPYKPAWPRARALDFVRAQSGRMFDPQLVETFLEAQMVVEVARQATI